jgi:hypothetical protein
MSRACNTASITVTLLSLPRSHLYVGEYGELIMRHDPEPAEIT